MATLTFKNVNKIYKDTPVIPDFNMSIEDGEFIVIVGPSGCGKSTLLRMIAGLEEISGGEMAIDDKVVNDLTPKNRDIAMVFQNYALYPHMSVKQNMAYGLKMRKRSKEDIAKRLKRVAEMLELDHLLDRKPAALSGGQRQRVAMGRAIVREPKLFLFDEPLSNLDAKLRIQMRLEIKKLQQSLGTTSIYVTHDQVEAMTLADRLVVLNKGIAEQIGTPLEIYEQPASVFVAGFIGSPPMNFIPAVVSEQGRAVSVSHTTFKLAEDAPTLQDGRKVTLGIRPEHVMTRIEPSMDTFEINVQQIETLGADTLLYGTVGDDDKTLTVRLRGAHRPAFGEKIQLGVSPKNLHLFDEITQLRIS